MARPPPPRDGGTVDAGHRRRNDAGVPDAGSLPLPDAGVPDAGPLPPPRRRSTGRGDHCHSPTPEYRTRARNRPRRDHVVPAARRVAVPLLPVDALEGPRQRSGGRLPDGGRRAAHPRPPRNGKAKDFGYLATWDDFANYRLRVRAEVGNATPSRRGRTSRATAGCCTTCAAPDEIWPQCVEFQIMEHNVGDLWMLSGTGVTAPWRTSMPRRRRSSPLGQERGRPRAGSVDQVRGARVAHRLELPRAHRLGTDSVAHRQRAMGERRDGHRGRRRRRLGGARATAASRSRPRARRSSTGTCEVRPLVYLPPPARRGGAVRRLEPRRVAGPRRTRLRAGRLVDGALEVVPGTGDLPDAAVRSATFGCTSSSRCPRRSPDAAEQDRGNSGVYLQGRYEVQVLDSFGPLLSGRERLRRDLRGEGCRR